MKPDTVTSTMEKSKQDLFLNRWLTPKWLIEGSLNDDVWKVQLKDPELSRSDPVYLRFNVPILPGPILLTDEGNESDLITVKIIIISSVSLIGGTTNSNYVCQALLRDLLQFIRWKRSEGIDRNSDLTEQWFDRYVQLLRKGGVSGLLPLKERISELLQGLQSGAISLPITSDGRGVAMDSLAKLIGLNRRRQVPAHLWAQVLKYLREEHSHLSLRNVAGCAKAERANSSFEKTRASLQVWKMLWIYRDKLAHDPLSFNPFIFQKCNTVARSIERPTAGTTPLPPSHQTLYIINSALKLVLEMGGNISQLQKGARESRRIVGKKGWHYELRWEIIREAFSNNFGSIYRPILDGGLVIEFSTSDASNWTTSVNINDFYNLVIPGAALVLLCGFLARRPGEIQSLRTNSFWTDCNDRSFVHTWISKTKMEYDDIPAPSALSAVFDLMTEIGEDRRRETGQTWLFESDGISRGATVRDLSAAINSFAKFCGVPPLDDGSLWDWKAYSLRHFFATTYYYRFHYPSLTAISRFLRHNNPDITRYYINTRVAGERLRHQDEISAHASSIRRLPERSRLRDFELVRTDFIKGVATQLLSGDSRISGHGANAWNRELQDLAAEASRSLSLTHGRDIGWTFDKVLSDWSKGKWLEPHPEGHSYCKCGPETSDLAIAACIDQQATTDQDRAVGPNFSNAVDLTCASCPHNIQLPCNEPEWRRRLKDAEDNAKNGFSDQDRVMGRRRSDEMTRHIRRCFE